MSWAQEVHPVFIVEAKLKVAVVISAQLGSTTHLGRKSTYAEK